MKARAALTIAVGITLVSAGAISSVVTAGVTVPASHLGVSDKAASAGQFKPSACTGTVSSIVAVPSGGAPFTVGTSNALIVGTSGNDNVTVTAVGGYECFVGGGPASSNNDKFAGSLLGGDQCVVANSDTGLLNVSNCTVVSRSP